MALVIHRGDRKRWDPLRDLWDLHGPMSRWLVPFDGAFPLGFGEARAGDGAWAVPLDVYETNDRLVVKAEMPGVKPEDINVTVLGRTLTIKGERRHDSEQKEGGCFRREIAYGSFQRELELPQGVDEGGLKATYRNGVLELALPKREEVKPRQINVEVN